MLPTCDSTVSILEHSVPIIDYRKPQILETMFLCLSVLYNTILADNRIGIEELHQIMVTARALAISRGVCSPTTELLEEARSMMKKIADRT